MNKSKQIIIYGAPGTGKSYNVDNFLKKNNVKEDQVIRVVFHSDYAYSDFVGFISPSTKNKGKEIEYNFEPGPFTIALEKALKNLSEDIYLILEELNRGNTAAIFGDVFQLLDRDDKGQSEYPITNRPIRMYLNDEISSNIFNELNLGENEITIPNNLKFICTMNTADQNVFVIDTAFKRRFKMHYVPINFENKTEQLEKLDNLSKTNIFNGNYTWSDFAKKINELIDNENYSGFSISEDKKLGQYFVQEKDVSSKQAFCDKVIYYLKNDVFKYNDKILINSYDNIYREFVLEGHDIFDLIE